MGDVDQQWLRDELARVVEDLTRSFPAAGAEQVSAAVGAAAGELVPPATVQHFLPVLIWRRAKARLERMQQAQPGLV